MQSLDIKAKSAEYYDSYHGDHPATWKYGSTLACTIQYMLDQTPLSTSRCSQTEVAHPDVQKEIVTALKYYSLISSAY